MLEARVGQSPRLKEYGQPLFVWLRRDWPSVRTYVLVHRLYGWGREDYHKGREGSLRRVLVNPHLLHCTFRIWSIDSCQNRIATDQYHVTISRAHLSTHRGDVIYLESVHWPFNCFTRSLLMFNLILSFILVWEHRKTDNAHILNINVVINWQLSKQSIRWPVSLDRIGGSGVDPSRSSIFWSYPLTSY